MYSCSKSHTLGNLCFVICKNGHLWLSHKGKYDYSDVCNLFPLLGAYAARLRMTIMGTVATGEVAYCVGICVWLTGYGVCLCAFSCQQVDLLICPDIGPKGPGSAHSLFAPGQLPQIYAKSCLSGHFYHIAF